MPLDRLGEGLEMNSWGFGGNEKSLQAFLLISFVFFLISDKLACAGFVFYLYESGLTQVRLRSCFLRYSPALSERNERSFDKTPCETEICLFALVHSVFRVSW